MQPMQKRILLIKIALVVIVTLVFISLLERQLWWRLLFSQKYLFYLFTTILAIAFLYLKNVSSLVRTITLLTSFVLFGILFSIHPSPLCAFTKSFIHYLSRGFVPPPMIVMAGIMILFTVAGNKVFCGWICPLGSVQEVIYNLSRLIKKFKIPFFITNATRFSFIAVFLIFAYGFRINIYNLFNPFELFHWQLHRYILIVLSMVLLASLWYYRPYCQFICPAGLITWIFEQLSLFKIWKNQEKCTRCNKCLKESPCTAIDGIIQDHTVTPDCFACGKCIESCPEDALSFSLRPR